jgi:dolichol kinase
MTMTSATSNAELEALRLLESYAQELRDFLETLPGHLKWERFDELRERSSRLLGSLPRPACDERLKARWALMQQRLSDLNAAITNQSPRARIMARYDELARDYEQWLSAYRARAHAVGMSTPVRASSAKPLIRARTLFHMAMGVLAISLYQFAITRTQAMIILWSLLGGAVSLEITRSMWSKWNRILLNSPVFHPIARPWEYHQVNSSTWYLTALCIVGPLFSQPAVSIAVLILALADPAAAWFGKRWGKRKLYRQKSYVGTLTFFVVGFLVAGAFLIGLWPSIPVARSIAAAALCSGVAAIAELFSERVDDNFTVPIAGAIAAALLI